MRMSWSEATGWIVPYNVAENFRHLRKPLSRANRSWHRTGLRYGPHHRICAPSGIGDCCYLPTLFDVQNAGASEWATPELFTIALIASDQPASHHQFANRPQKLHVVDNRIFRRVLGGGILIRTRARRFSPRRHYRETLFGGICATVRNQIRSQSS